MQHDVKRILRSEMMHLCKWFIFTSMYLLSNHLTIILLLKIEIITYYHFICLINNESRLEFYKNNNKKQKHIYFCVELNYIFL